MKQIKRPLSKIGIFSCSIAIGVWIYLGFLAVIFTQTDFVSVIGQFLKSGQSGMQRGMSDLGAGLFLLIVLFVVVPIVGHLIGLICGAIGSFRSSTRRWPAFIGVFLNIAPFIIGFVLFLIGWAAIR